MPARKRIQPDERVPLRLTAAERKLVLEDLMCLDQKLEDIIRNTPTGKPLMMTLDDLDDFGGHIAAEANHCDSTKKQERLDAVFEKVQGVLDKYTDEEPPKTVKIDDARKEKVIFDQAAQIAQFAAQALAAAEQLGVKQKAALEHFSLAPAQREVLSLVPSMTKAIKKKLAQDDSNFSIEEVASMTLALAEDLPDGDARKQVAVMYLAKHLMDHLQEGIMAKAEPPARKKSKHKPKANPDVLCQFKITLLESNPPIWRRIQVQDCTLDKLHEHIQTAMGWTNSHLHQFDIQGERYGDPELLNDDTDGIDCIDSTTTMLSDILPKTGKRFAFHYEYDFGDSWEHEVLFEGFPPLEKGKKYPLCLEGGRACPPEDCGGVWGYAEFLDAISNPEHEEHEDMLNWIGGSFDPEEFDPKQATREMKKGLPDWRSM